MPVPLPLSAVGPSLRVYGFECATRESEACSYLASTFPAGIVFVCREAALPGNIASLMLGNAPLGTTPDGVATALEKNETVKNDAKAAGVVDAFQSFGYGSRMWRLAAAFRSQCLARSRQEATSWITDASTTWIVRWSARPVPGFGHGRRPGRCFAGGATVQRSGSRVSNWLNGSPDFSV